MSSDFYVFKHRCFDIPDEVSFCKIKDSKSSQFTVHKYVSDSVAFETTLYGFKYCPYCGEEFIEEPALQ